MQYPVETLSKVTDPSIHRLLSWLFLENERLNKELSEIKMRKGLPQELKIMGEKSQEPNILT